jgi:hypothetical protein
MRIIFLVIILSVCFIQFSIGQTEKESQNSELSVVRKQRDSIPAPDTVIHSWKYAKNSFVKLYAEFDTTLMAVQLPEEYRRKWPGYVGLGNLGTAVQNISFFQRREHETFWMIKNFYPYINTHHKQEFYNTKTPFTQLHYISAGRKLEYFTFNHTQNYNRNINFGLSYEIFNSKGYLIYQETRNRNLSFWTDINYKRYQVYASINFNGINVSENGGIRSGFLLKDTALSLQEMNTKLNSGNNHFSYFNGAIDQRFRLFKLNSDSISTSGIWIAHHFSFDKVQRMYVDESESYVDPETDEELYFYENSFNGTSTNDTISYIDYKNRASLEFEHGGKTTINFGPFLEHRLIKHTNLFRDTLFTYNNDTAVQTLSVGGQLTINFPKNFGIDLQALYYPFEDYNYENYHIVGNLVKWQKIGRDTLYAHIQFSHEEKKPDYFLTKYYSNHFKWVNQLKEENEQKIQFNLRLMKSRFYLGLSLNSIDNYIYFGEDSKVAQYPDKILVYRAELNKKFTFWNRFNLELNILRQYTGTEQIDIPDYSFKGTFFYTQLIKFPNTGGELKFYVGFTGKINSKYYAPSYSPATAQFHLQKEELIGNYPMLDIFAGARISRFLFFLRMDHVNSGMQNASYYSAIYYPMRPRNLRFGVSWNFYN